MKIGSRLICLLKSVILILSVLNIVACGKIIASAKQDFADDLSETILEFDDPETIKRGVPTYLILISSMIKGDPDNPELLETAARLYSAYASAFADSPASKKALANRAFNYASRSICLRNSKFCDVRNISFTEFEKRLATVEKIEAEPLLVFVSSWAGMIEANSDDWNAVAELPKVKAGIQCVLEVDETVSNGNAHLYMAVMESILPPALGGKPEVAKRHYERVIEISKGANLMAKVLYADKYARMMFDRELHDRLLQQVIDADIGPNDQRLINTFAKQKAAELMSSADEYF
jgi:hypothetical protein